MKQKRNRKETHRWSGDVWQLNDKHGPRSGPNSANEAKQQGGDRTPDRKTEKQKTGTGNVRDMPEGGGNTSPQKVS